MSVRKERTSKERARLRVRRSLLVLVGATGFLFIVIPSILGHYAINGNGMKNTLSDGQSILVNKMAYQFRDPQRGDVILFNNPGTPGRYSVARVIGLPGDTIRLDTNDVWVNDIKLDESYLTNPSDPYTDGFDQPVKVPPGEYFMLGDNRPDSEDSRFWGFLPKSNILGQVFMVSEPLDQLQFIDTHPSVYSLHK